MKGTWRGGAEGTGVNGWVTEQLETHLESQKFLQWNSKLTVKLFPSPPPYLPFLPCGSQKPALRSLPTRVPGMGLRSSAWLQTLLPTEPCPGPDLPVWPRSSFQPYLLEEVAVVKAMKNPDRPCGCPLYFTHYISPFVLLCSYLAVSPLFMESKLYKWTLWVYGSLLLKAPLSHTDLDWLDLFSFSLVPLSSV